ncbi:MAG: YjgP/YjgQ family permease [Proteobacteria bacterium]|nr:YjgP/YjgQ family permease [Pseudomonadota bacterium]
MPHEEHEDVMRILSRYIFAECLSFLGIAIFALTGILLTVQMLKFSDLIINRGVRIDQIAWVFLAITPTFMELAIPMAALLGVMLAFSRLSGDSELVVLRGSGVSLYQLLTPVLVLALGLCAIALQVSTELKPWGYRTLATMLFEIAKSRSTAGLEEGVFNKLGDITLYGQAVDYQTGVLQGVVVDDRRDENNRKIIFATRAAIVSNAQEKTITIKLYEGSMHEQVEGKYILTRFITNDVVMNPDQLYGSQATTEVVPRAMTLPELAAEQQRFIQLKEELSESERAAPNADGSPLELNLPSGKKMTVKSVTKHIRRLQMEYAARWSMPYASFILALAAVPLGIQPPRTQRAWGPTIAFGLGLLVFVAYYALLSFGMTLQDNGRISATAAAWLPNIVVTAAAAGMFIAIGTERVQSVPQLFESWGRGLRQLLPRARNTRKSV